MIDTENPASPTRDLELDGPVDQRLAPGGAVHDDATRAGATRKFLIAEDEVRRRGGRAGLPERRLPRLRDHRRAREGAGEGGLLEHRRRRLLRQRRGHLHGARVPRSTSASSCMTAAFYNGGVRVVDLSGPVGHLAGQQPAGRRGHEGDRLLPDAGRRHLVGEDAADRPQDRRLLPVRQRHQARARHLPLRRRGQEAEEPREVDERAGGERRAGRTGRRRASSGTTYICLLDD